LSRSGAAGAAVGRNEGEARTGGSGKRAKKSKKMAKNVKKMSKKSKKLQENERKECFLSTKIGH